MKYFFFVAAACGIGVAVSILPLSYFNQPSPPRDEAKPVTAVQSDYTWPTTLEHDGHKFVCWGGFHGYDGASIIHHPGCPCLNK
jgi:hypothetical protein